MSAVCPYCRCPLEEGEAQLICPGCATPHHADCFQENGGCTVFGCSQAPSDEPALHVSSGEIGSATMAAPTGWVAPQPGYARPQSLAAPGVAAPAQQWQATAPAPAVASQTDVEPPLSLAGVYAGVQQRRKRTTFVLLGVFLGAFGVHNFYAGYYRRGAGQLCLTLFTLFYAAIVSEIWAIVEVCAVARDGDDRDFE